MNCIIIIGRGKDKDGLMYIPDIYDFLTNKYKLLKLEKYKRIFIFDKEYEIDEKLFDLIEEQTFISTYADFYIDNYDNASNCIDGEIFITNFKLLSKMKPLDENIVTDDKYKLFLKLNKELFVPLPFPLKKLII